MLVRPTQAFVARHENRDVVLGPADILDDSHPIVRSHPDLFERVRPTVEQATANPGEMRNTRRG
jgi:hypothetical protein